MYLFIIIILKGLGKQGLLLPSQVRGWSTSMWWFWFNSFCWMLVHIKGGYCSVYQVSLQNLHYSLIIVSTWKMAKLIIKGKTLISEVSTRRIHKPLPKKYFPGNQRGCIFQKGGEGCENFSISVSKPWWGNLRKINLIIWSSKDDLS